MCSTVYHPPACFQGQIFNTLVTADSALFFWRNFFRAESRKHKAVRCNIITRSPAVLIFPLYLNNLDLHLMQSEFLTKGCSDGAIATTTVTSNGIYKGFSVIVAIVLW